MRRHHELLEGTIKPGDVDAYTFGVEVADRIAIGLAQDGDDGIAPEQLAKALDQVSSAAPEIRQSVDADALSGRIDQIRSRSSELL